MAILKDPRFDGVIPVNLTTDHSGYVADRCNRAEEVGMFETSAIFKDVYEAELTPNFETNDGSDSGFKYEFKHLLIESPDHNVRIDEEWYCGSEECFHYINITDVTSYGDDYVVFIRLVDINEAFLNNFIDSINENLILFNHLVQEKYQKGAIIYKRKYESYNLALKYVTFYNFYVVPALNVPELVLFDHTEKDGRVVVHVA